jgi:hypothetical protein
MKKLEKLEFNKLSELLVSDNVDLALTDFPDYDSKKVSSASLKIEDPNTFLMLEVGVKISSDLTVKLKDKYDESDAFEILETFTTNSTTPYAGTFVVAPLETYFYGEDGSVEIELSTSTTNLDAMASEVNVYKVEF